MAYEFWDTVKNEWNPAHESDSIYQYGMPEGGTAPSGWSWSGGDIAEGQMYREASDGGGIEVENPFPDYLSQFAENTINKYGTSFLDEVQGAINRIKAGGPYEADTRTMATNAMTAFDNLAEAPAWIEQRRTELPKQFLAGLEPMQNYYQPALNSMASRGILNSSITGNALGDIQNNINRQYAEQVAGANTLASQLQLEHLNNMPTVASNLMGALNNLDRYWLAKESTVGGLGGQGQGLVNQIAGLGASEASYDPWNSLLPYLIGG